jgi:RNA polymerase sigma factor (sigma-70 family)
MATVTVKDIVLTVVIPLILAEVGPWGGWLAARLLPRAAKLRYGDTERAAVRCEEWSDDLDDIPGQLTKLAYAVGHLLVGTAVSVQRKIRHVGRESWPEARREIPVMTVSQLVNEYFKKAPERDPAVRALHSLPDRQRDILVLRAYVRGLTGAQIADAMGISKRTVKRDTARGMATLRCALEQEPKTDRPTQG